MDRSMGEEVGDVSSNAHIMDAEIHSNQSPKELLLYFSNLLLSTSISDNRI